mmetsp:Transcript_15523/g.35545  ORF Transcript_15523/g.35545 Transcript_15523/m.35545 type:complete len:209 (+) Transcript_15523:984-1610(+)
MSRHPAVLEMVTLSLKPPIQSSHPCSRHGFVTLRNLDVAVQVTEFLQGEIKGVPSHGEFQLILGFFLKEANEVQLALLRGFRIIKFFLCLELFLFAGPDTQTWCGVLIFEGFWYVYGSMLSPEVKEFLIAKVPFEICRGVRRLIFEFRLGTQLRQLCPVNRRVSTLPIIGELRLITLPTGQPLVEFFKLFRGPIRRRAHILLVVVGSS